MKIVPLYTNKETRALDAYAQETLGYPESTLMGMAALTVFHANEDLWSTAEEIWIFAGTGGNGGDGYALANILNEEGFAVRVFATGKSKRKDVQFYVSLCEKAQVPLHSLSEIDQYGREAETGTILLVDALLGTGFLSPLSLEMSRLISWINASPLFFYKLSLDTASGHLPGEPSLSIEADSIEELGTRKWENIGYTLEDKIVPRYYESIGFPLRSYISPSTFSNRFYFEKLEIEEILPKLKRKPTAHKYSAGSAIFYGGDEGMEGAILLSSSAFQGLGGGISKIFSPATSTKDLVLHSDPSRMVSVSDGTDIESDSFYHKTNTIIVGPGLKTYPSFLNTFSLGKNQTLVLDAGAIPGKESTIPKGKVLLTPHAGEFERMTGKKCGSVQAAYEIAVPYCLEKGVNVLFKSHVSLFVTENGEAFVWESPNASLSTMGSGDLLVGILSRFLSMGYSITESVYYSLSLLEVTRDMQESYPTAFEILQFLLRKL